MLYSNPAPSPMLKYVPPPLTKLGIVPPPGCDTKNSSVSTWLQCRKPALESTKMPNRPPLTSARGPTRNSSPRPPATEPSGKSVEKSSFPAKILSVESIAKCSFKFHVAPSPSARVGGAGRHPFRVAHGEKATSLNCPPTSKRRTTGPAFTLVPDAFGSPWEWIAGTTSTTQSQRKTRMTLRPSTNTRGDVNLYAPLSKLCLIAFGSFS